MKKLKFPILSGNKKICPEDKICPICGKEKVSEPNSFVFISGGSTFTEKENSISSLEKKAGYLYLTWHGAHDNGTGIFPGIYTALEIVDDASHGQFELQFCSPECLRKFFNKCVDELERKMEDE